MIAHVATVDGTEEQLDQFMEILKTGVSPVVRERPGYIEGIALVDRASGRGLLVTLWKDKASADASSQRWREEGATRGTSETVGLRRSAQWYEVALRTLPSQ